MEKQADIIEIFSSIQGEGPYIGCRQIFVRFAGCNLSCNYCDTDFQPQDFCRVHKDSDVKKIRNPVSLEQLIKEIKEFKRLPFHSISLTGGEPLMYVDFLVELLPKLKDTVIYLETNGTLVKELEKIIEHIGIISTDVKLKSSTGAEFPAEKHKRFIETALSHNKEIFAKAVITSKTSDEEIKEVSDLLNSFGKDILLVLQPVDSKSGEISVSTEKLLQVQEKFLAGLRDVRVIPQVHKFLGLL